MYVGDHGESLGEKGLYLHGMPYFFAPNEQTHVPVIMWGGNGSEVTMAGTTTLQHQTLSHDAVVPTLLRIFEVRSNILDGTVALFGSKAVDTATN
jgi:lipid A ethanolaminephosphotransferase